MRLLARLRERSAAKRETKISNFSAGSDTVSSLFVPDVAIELPDTLLKDILSFVCPHSRDDSHASSEDSMIDGVCPLCDLEDLAHCGLVSRQWSKCAKELL